uniref:Epidermal patterning factor-like protein n=1 Tax=Zea mays TaxID=4577 RepID=B6TPZ7_MAIZE|nr:hypothetical protein [Zea mays]
MELQLYHSTTTLLLPLLLLLLLLLPSSSSSSSHGLRSADGSRAPHYRLKDPRPPKIGDGEGAATADSLIGSRPPRCDGKCAPCGRCESSSSGEKRRTRGQASRLAKASSSSSASVASSSASWASGSTVMDWGSPEEAELQSGDGFSLLVYAWKN